MGTALRALPTLRKTISAVLFRPVVFHVPHGAHGASAATAETFIPVANRIGAVSAHGVRARRRISILGHGLSYLIAIGRGLSPRRACGQQCEPNCNEDPSHSTSFPSVVNPEPCGIEQPANGRKVPRSSRANGGEARSVGKADRKSTRLNSSH